MFGKLSNLGDPNKTGSGIGLTICKIIAEKHGGDIFVSSVPFQQTIFTFSIPTEF